MANLALLVGLGLILGLITWVKKGKRESDQDKVAVPKRSSKTLSVEHRKKEYLSTENEKKLFFALQKALSEKYIISSQVSLIALVEPLDYRHNSKSWAKRVDFVITDTASKIVAVIELDDSTHRQKKRMERDAYVNNALEGHHPLIRINTEKFYDPVVISSRLEKEAGIESIF